MFQIRLDSTSDYHIQLPQKPAGIITLAEKYLAYEGALASSQRLPSPPFDYIQEITSQARRFQRQARQQEAQRSVASSHAQEIFHTLLKTMNRAIAALKYRHIDNLMHLEAWGLQVKQGKRGTQVRKPSTSDEWAVFVADYMEQEERLLPAERLTNPPLMEVIYAFQLWQTHEKSRQTAFAERQVAIQNRNETTQELYLLLQLAAHSIILLRCGGKISQKMEHWGFHVVKTSSPPPPQ